MGESIERKAWRKFSEYIRLRDSTDLLLTECISCGHPDFYDNMDCGHYIDRRYKSTMFDEINNHPQCRRCNRELDGNTAEYRKALVKRYGERAVEMLEEKAKKMEKPDYNLLYKIYKKRVEALQRGRYRHIFQPEFVKITQLSDRTGRYKFNHTKTHPYKRKDFLAMVRAREEEE